MSGQVSVNPNDLASFADYCDELLERLRGPYEDFATLDDGSGGIDMGRFQQGAGFAQSHQGLVENTVTAARDLARQIEVLRDAARDIGEQYRSTEEVNEALVRATERLLGDPTAP